MQYHEVLPIGREQAEAAFASGTPEQINDALVSIAYHDPDWRWAQARCLELAGHPDPGVRATAATCLGHIARIHRQLDLDQAEPVLHKLQQDPITAGFAEDALEDIRIFMGKRG